MKTSLVCLLLAAVVCAAPGVKQTKKSRLLQEIKKATLLQDAKKARISGDAGEKAVAGIKMGEAAKRNQEEFCREEGGVLTYYCNSFCEIYKDFSTGYYCCCVVCDEHNYESYYNYYYLDMLYD